LKGSWKWLDWFGSLRLKGDGMSEVEAMSRIFCGEASSELKKDS
jgi:hypothetical protein